MKRIKLAMFLSLLFGASIIRADEGELKTVISKDHRPSAKQPKLPKVKVLAESEADAIPATHYYFGDSHGDFITRGQQGVVLGKDLFTPPHYFKGTLTYRGDDPDFVYYHLDGYVNDFGFAKMPDASTMKYHIIASNGSNQWVDWDDALDHKP